MPNLNLSSVAQSTVFVTVDCGERDGVRHNLYFGQIKDKLVT